jgi:hypothetical protein
MNSGLIWRVSISRSWERLRAASREGRSSEETLRLRLQQRASRMSMDLMLNRIRGEFREMPGLRLTLL